MWKYHHVKYLSFLSSFNETWIFSTNFRKSSNIKFLQSPSSVSRVVPCGKTDGLTDITKLLVTLRNVANAPKNHSVIGICCPRYRQHRKTNEENIQCKYAIFWFLCCCQLILISELTVTCIIYWTRIENLFKTNLRFLNDLCSLKHVYISGCHQSSIRALLSAERLQ